MSKTKKPKPKYDSSRKREDYTFHPARRFELTWDPEPGPCYLFALDERQAATLRKMVQVFPKYHWVWGLESPRRDWDAATWQLWNDIEAFVDELEACLVSGCDLNEWLKQQRMLTAAIVGEQVDLTDPAQLSPDAVDFRAESATPGLVPKIDQMLNVDRSLYADMNIAEVLFEGLVGRRVSVPIPFDGTGLADIADEQLDVLHNRFRMSDSSLFNPLGGEKNLVEALETQLRVDKVTDLEFLTPNVATVLNQVLKLENDSPLRTLFDQIYEWVTGNPAPPVPDYNTVAELLLLIAKGQEQTSIEVTTQPQPISLSTTVTCKCGGSGCGGCGGSEPPSEPAIEGDPPPTGWIEPTDDTGTAIVPGQPEYQSRKCKAANAVHEHLKNGMGKIKDVNFWGIGLDTIVTILGAAWLIAIRTLLMASLGSLGRLAGLAEGSAGWLDELAQSLVEYGVDLTVLHQALIDNEQSLVCAFYNASTMLEAINTYVQVLDDAGLGEVNQAVVKAFLTADLLNIVYFEKENFEAALDGYTGPVDCSVCEEAVPPLFPFDADLEGWYLVESDPIYPSLPNTNQTLVWQDHAYFPSTGEALASSADGESCYISSPVVNYFLDPLQSHTFEWNRKASNVTYKLSLWMSDGSEINLESDGTGYPDGVNSHNLDAYHGQTVRTIELSFGAAAGSRDFVIDYINITSV